MLLIGAGKTDEAEAAENPEASGGRGGRGGRGGGRGGKAGVDKDAEKKPTGPLTDVTITYTIDAYSGKNVAEASNGMVLQTNEAGKPVDKKGIPLMQNDDGTWSQQKNGFSHLCPIYYFGA